MNDFSDRNLVIECQRQIEYKLEWGPSESWHNDVFQELSNKIQSETGVLLSSTTLKRVWGKVQYENSPSISTLNTLAQFVGYVNWRDFKNKNTKTSTLRVDPEGLKSKSRRKMVFLVSAFMVVSLLAVALIAFNNINSAKEVEPAEIVVSEFSSYPVTDDLPNSVVFKINMDPVVSDSIFIQQYWDPTKTIKITSEQKEATGIYYYPGYYRAKLLVDGNSLSEHDVFIKTKNWVATIDYSPVPKYLDVPEPGTKLSLPADAKAEITSSEKPVNSTFHYVDDLGIISADDFTLSATIQHQFLDRWGVCQFTRIYILGTTGAMIIPFSISGCISDLNLMLNDQYVQGKSADLSAFGVDMSEPTRILIEVSDKKVRINAVGQDIYQGQYFESAGRLVGVRIRFQGFGEVKDLEILDNNQNRVAIN